MNAFRRLLCRWKGHKWGKGKDMHIHVLADTLIQRIKTCARCKAEKTVKRRKPALSPQ